MISWLQRVAFLARSKSWTRQVDWPMQPSSSYLLYIMSGSLSCFYFVSWENDAFQVFLILLSSVAIALGTLCLCIAFAGRKLGPIVFATLLLVPAILNFASAPALALQIAILVVLAGIRILASTLHSPKTTE